MSGLQVLAVRRGMQSAFVPGIAKNSAPSALGFGARRRHLAGFDQIMAIAVLGGPRFWTMAVIDDSFLRWLGGHSVDVCR